MRKEISESEIPERLKQQFEFILEIDKEKMIERQTHLSDGLRRENDAEHAWHLALMTILLGEYSNEPVDLLKTVTMVLIHDIVEIDAGDTYAYDEEGKKTQQEREQKAADRIFRLLPEDQSAKLRGIWDEFEAWETPEAKFAHVMDNVQPAMLNAATGGNDWAKRRVKLEQILKRNEHTAEGSEYLWQYMLNQIIGPNVENGNIAATPSEKNQLKQETRRLQTMAEKSESRKEMDRVLEQEKNLSFSSFTYGDAWRLAELIQEGARRENSAVSMRIELNGTVILQYLMDGTAEENLNWMRRKCNMVHFTGHSSYYVYHLLKENNDTIENWGLDLKDYTFMGGGFPLKIGGSTAGAVIVSGCPHEIDHKIVTDAIAALIREKAEAAV